MGSAPKGLTLAKSMLGALNKHVYSYKRKNCGSNRWWSHRTGTLYYWRKARK